MVNSHLWPVGGVLSHHHNRAGLLCGLDQMHTTLQGVCQWFLEQDVFPSCDALQRQQLVEVMRDHEHCSIKLAPCKCLRDISEYLLPVYISKRNYYMGFLLFYNLQIVIYYTSHCSSLHMYNQSTIVWHSILASTL